MAYNLKNIENHLTILSKTSGVDLKTVGTTNLYTVPTGKTAIVIGVLIRITSQSGFVTVATAGIGSNSGEDNVVSAIALTNLDNTSKVFSTIPSGTYSTISASSIIKLGIDIGAVATTLTAEVILLGFLI